MIDRGRFVLEHVRDGGLLLDLTTGNLFRINQTAAFVWDHALAGVEVPEVARRLSDAFDIPEAVARRDVDATLSPPRELPLSSPLTEFRYEREGADYRFSAGALPLLLVETAANRVLALGDFDRADTGIWLRSVTPKLVSLLGWSVLHGSAVSRPDGSAILFLGESGAGKTTTARALASAASGWRVVSEDKVVLRVDGAVPTVAAHGESRINAWIASARAVLAGGVGTPCDLAPLGAAGEGQSLPISGVVLLDARRRRGPALELVPLGEAAAAQQIFRHGFYGSAVAADWRRQVRTTAMVARTATTYEGTMPDGVEALAQAARSYTETMAS